MVLQGNSAKLRWAMRFLVTSYVVLRPGWGLGAARSAGFGLAQSVIPQGPWGCRSPPPLETRLNKHGSAEVESGKSPGRFHRSYAEEEEVPALPALEI